MALSMDEQRMLAEIERRLAAEDPGLATKLSSFRRPRPPAGLRSTRGKLIGSLCTLLFLVVIGVTVYATIAARAHTLKTPPTRTTQSATSQAAGAKAQAVPAVSDHATQPPLIIGENNVPSHNG